LKIVEIVGLRQFSFSERDSHLLGLKGTTMERRQCVQQMVALAVALVSAPMNALVRADQSRRSGQNVERLDKPKSEWRKLLTPEQYGVLLEEDTERAFSSPLNNEKRQGTYICAACHLPLFSSKTKFDSGTGWPSFYEPIAGRVTTKRDFKLILPRTEYHCVRCGGHQGHLFTDGPPPTGQRWCNNGLALKFVPDGESLPPLRP
jgi:peptide-methionine (R)-S-oxide reductase